MTDARTVIAGVRVFSVHDDKTVHTQPLGPHVTNDIISALRAAGLRIVPEVPTEKMVNAYTDTTWRLFDTSVQECSAHWKAMLEAADEQ
jgi:hypothetical protein